MKIQECTSITIHVWYNRTKGSTMIITTGNRSCQLYKTNAIM